MMDNQLLNLKTMKTLLTVIALSAATLSFAQTQKTMKSTEKTPSNSTMQTAPDQDMNTRVKMQSDRITRELNLNAEQSKKVMEQTQVYYNDHAAMNTKNVSSTDRDMMRTKSMEKYDTSMRETLNADQYTKFSSMKGEYMMDPNQSMPATMPMHEKRME